MSVNVLLCNVMFKRNQYLRPKINNNKFFVDYDRSLQII
jgi:hypothetical protein